MRGIRTTLRASTALLIVASLAVIAFLVLAIRYLFLKSGLDGVISSTPFYNPLTFSGSVLGGVSLAAITYIGFDGLTTLAEDSVNPRRDMVLATVLVVLVTGILSAIELYFLHGVLPDWRSANPQTSYLDVMRLVGGPALFIVFLVVMSISQFGAGCSVQVSAARLLYGMGRDDVLPRSIFGYLSPQRRSPSRNILILGVVAFIGTVFIPFDLACDLLNFGAFVGFMGVNLAVVWSYYVRPKGAQQRGLLWDGLLPATGFCGCLIFWLDLPQTAKTVGEIWLLLGFVYCAYKTRGFRERPVLFEPLKSE